MKYIDWKLNILVKDEISWLKIMSWLKVTTFNEIFKIQSECKISHLSVKKHSDSKIQWDNN